jgi:hypothetical protein
MNMAEAFAVFTATAAAAAIGLAATAHADKGASFQAPGGNVACDMGGQVTTAYCVIANFDFVPPVNCPPGQVANAFSVRQGGGADGPQCRPTSDGFVDRPRATMDFEQTQRMGTLSCQFSMGATQSQPWSTLCRDNSTGHYFRVSIENYELG